MSQVAAKKKLTLRDEHVKVIAHFREEGAVLANTQQGFCEDFEIEFSANGDLSVEEVTKMIQLAHRMCFTESVLTNIVKVNTRHIYNDQVLEE